MRQFPMITHPSLDKGTYQLSTQWFTPDRPPAGLSHIKPLGIQAFTKNLSAFEISPETPLCRLEMTCPFMEPAIEVWHSSAPVSYDRFQDISVGHDDETLMGVIALGGAGDDLALSARRIYDQIFRCLDHFGYPFPFRIWNYIPAINASNDLGLERYRAFCLGRSEAFFADRQCSEKFLPAGTGVGCLGERVKVVFMAARTAAPTHFENPRQLPAYHYPVCYGPKSPSFARATFVPRNHGQGEIYISGTASIIGHETLHGGDVVKQCLTTLENMELLLSEANLKRYNINHSVRLSDLAGIKVYLRQPRDLPLIKPICETRLSRNQPIQFLRGDICRSDLLIEIEGKAWIPSRGRNASARFIKKER